jgi:ubiquinone biosynthesis monooxygenase Coq6
VGYGRDERTVTKEGLRRAYKVTLIEASDLAKAAAWNPPADNYENRCSSITRKNRAFLKRGYAPMSFPVSFCGQALELGIMSERIELLLCWTCRSVDLFILDASVEEVFGQVWDGMSKARLHLDNSDAQPDLSELEEDPGMAFMTENANLQQALLSRLHELAYLHKFELVAPTKVSSIHRDTFERGSWPILTLSNGKEIRARLLVGADGPNSPVRKYADIDTTGWAYDEHGVVATLQLEPFSDNRTAWQRFLPSGPVALLPVR